MSNQPKVRLNLHQDFAAYMLSELAPALARAVAQVGEFTAACAARELFSASDDAAKREQVAHYQLDLAIEDVARTLLRGVQKAQAVESVHTERAHEA